MTNPDLPDHREQRPGGLSLDWWATLTAGVVVLLAVLDLLPKIPW